ncbi:MAG TPA: mandelate racemase/muconate lactonizing enzyme family protein [Burkholderiales bacterium]|jgi:L-alanine-DL-glutamate epimerase-like enolase superfamily enzyme|nr:mandelate racemase/muconate lactonizing enzyme family protein [Burkholderiales bacterium]
MKITKVETIVVTMPMLIEGSVLPQQGGKPRTSMDTLLVRVDTDEGVSGWGEGFGHRILPATRTAIDTLVGPLCVGRDPTAISSLVEELQRFLSGVGRNGPAMYALSAIDIALWDIAGKLAKLPLYRLLGGAPRNELPAYASLLRYGEPAAVTQYTERALKRGYRYIKLHEITVSPIKAARDVAGPDIPIMVDCNCPWTVSEAIAMARKLAPFNLKWLEEPVWPPEDHVGLARVQTEGGIPTAAGENAMLPEFRSMLAAGALAYAQPSVTKVGGVTQLRKVAALADAHGVPTVPHSAYFGPGLIASIHCIAAMSRESLVERYDADFAVNPLHDAILPDAKGCMKVPQGPGLGVEPDMAVVEKLRVR